VELFRFAHVLQHRLSRPGKLSERERVVSGPFARVWINVERVVHQSTPLVKVIHLLSIALALQHAPAVAMHRGASGTTARTAERVIAGATAKERTETRTSVNAACKW
jgi:hypothetical protein